MTIPFVVAFIGGLVVCALDKVQLQKCENHNTKEHRQCWYSWITIINVNDAMMQWNTGKISEEQTVSMYQCKLLDRRL